MNLFNKLYENVNPNKLVDELQAQGLLEQEKMAFFPKGNGLEIRFVDIKEFIEDTDEEGNIMDSEFYYTYYKKKNIKTVTEVNEETGEETPKEVVEWLDYTTEFEQVLADIDTVISNHDPTPLPQPPTLEERLTKIDQDIQTNYEMNLDNMGVW